MVEQRNLILLIIPVALVDAGGSDDSVAVRHVALLSWYFLKHQRFVLR
jgi:hypothetical protein